ncbi:VCBS repeat-containing protein [Portibacter marinus]|uniref:VCBS repeat-containing protein n=1 Tax=Portibacter marinus TaxID=2898660 RepID=UPI001F392A8F|nr:VCBS repeat-containing protein [Portibacter marinus]
MKRSIYFSVILIGLLSACSSEQFEFLLHSGEELGIDFNNKLEQKADMNILDYLYFFNGGGVGAGDFNNDGLMDLYFSGNQVSNRLYLNEGNLKFKDITEEAFQELNNSWSTGVSVIDINHDGLLDIYVCEVNQIHGFEGHNRLYICQTIEDGIPKYKEASKEYGLDFSGLSTQAAFFDYDVDGDLDMFLLNHSVHNNNTFGPRSNFVGQVDSISGDRLYRNEDSIYVNISEESGIYTNSIGYGLGVAVSDINQDGYPDLYIGNDFHENDYLYINNRDGTFSDQINQQIPYTSRFSMGVDIADLNNDGWSDVFTLDMMPYDDQILRRSEGEDLINTYNYKLRFGYNYQFARNTMQINTGNNQFIDLAMYSGVHATDWSWSTFLADLNMDGRKDIFVSNGIPKRMNDIDYINFISNSELQKNSAEGQLSTSDLEMLSKIPEIKIKNQIFYNKEGFKFEHVNAAIKNNQEGYSNGATYCDLDNDGDLDIVANNINGPAFIYENKNKTNSFVNVHLEGQTKNPDGIGTKLILENRNGIDQYLEFYPVRGFQSCSHQTPVFYIKDSLDYSLTVIWPDGKSSTQEVGVENDMTFKYNEASKREAILLVDELDKIKFQEVTLNLGLKASHKENPFIDFDREPLIPFSVSTEGPALAIGDLNHDGYQDIFLGGSKRENGFVYLQESEGFTKSDIVDLAKDSMYEDIDALILDFNGDGLNDLLVLSGGNEFSLSSKYNQPRLYLQNRNGWMRKADAFNDIFLTGQAVAAEDWDQDGDLDLFLGARSVPGSYGQTPNSYLLTNDGSGRFTRSKYEGIEALELGGLVKDAIFANIDKDPKKELIVAYEWGHVKAYKLTGAKVEIISISDQSGLWNGLIVEDFDKDGDQDILALNTGLNNKFKLDDNQSLKLYFNDFDDNGTKEQILTYYVNGVEIPFATKGELQTQIPSIKKKFLFAEDFATANLEDLVGNDKIKGAKILKAETLKHALFVNNGRGEFKLAELPEELQYYFLKDGMSMDVNDDGLPDIVLGGNFYDNNIQMGRYDGNYGTIMINEGTNNFRISSLQGLSLKGQVRRTASINIKGQKALIFARNNETAAIFMKLKNEL